MAESPGNFLKKRKLPFFNHFCFICAAFILLCALPYQAECADKKIGAGDRAIASTFKALAKGFVFTVDLEKIKQENTARISAMKDEKYRRHYLKAFAFTQELPAGIRQQYGLGENMTKEEAIKAIRRLNKERVYLIIDAVPDALIAREFRKYLSSVKRDIRESDLVAQINSFWDKAVKKAGGLKRGNAGPGDISKR